LADFGAEPEAMRQKINGWVEDKTHNRIVDMFPEGAISADTVWVLVNAIYLKAPWVAKFDEQATSDMAFTRLDGSEVTVPTMRSHLMSGDYAEEDGYKIIDLNLRGGSLSVTFILPDQDRYAEIEAALSVDTLDAMLGKMENGMLDINLPRFEISSGSVLLNDHLQALGMMAPFSESADFTGFGPGVDTQIQFVYHSVFVSANEVGIEAAGATENEGDGDDDSDMFFDAHRPFIFLIRDKPTGLVLFAGRVVDPSAGRDTGAR
jgi:serpin B